MTNRSANQPMVVISGKTEIPVANLWLLLLYASKFYGSGSEALGGAEEYPELLPELLAEILVASVGERIRQPLTPVFSPTTGDLGRVRGRIDVLRTESHQLLRRGKIACRFEQLTVDSPRNRMVLAALRSIGPLLKSTELAAACRRAARELERRGVSKNYGAQEKTSAEHRTTRNDTRDRRMFHAAQLALSLDLPTDAAASSVISRRHLDIHEFRRLFEAAVGGLYAATLPPLGWSVSQGRQLSWHVRQPSGEAIALLPRMQTDIILEHAATRRRIIIDTKFTSITGQGKGGKETFKSGHLYQLYAYLRTQESESDELSCSTEGMLVYPATGPSINESFVLSNHKITAVTIDLARPAVEVRAQLMEIVRL